MKKAKIYKVKRGIEITGKWRHEPGVTVAAKDIPGAPVNAWLKSGVLEEVIPDGDG